MQEKSDGRFVVVAPIMLFSDDTSGNKSKKWHKFDSWSVMLCGLPRQENAKLYNIHFCCCSDVVSAMDMSGMIAKELKELEVDGVEVYDSFLNQMVLVIAPLMCILADNPRASELINHLGGSARKYCRMCMVDRDGDPTVIGQKRTLNSSLQQIEDIKTQRTEHAKAQLRTRYGIKETFNPMLSIPADLYRSTPVESLHTILLGPYKYLLKSIIPQLSARQKLELLARIRAFHYSGFKVRIHGNLVQYHQSFLGRDYKAWAQMALFIIYPYLSRGDKKVWLCLTKLFRLAYSSHFDIAKVSEYEQVCADFVSAVSVYRPEMLKKSKIHLLLHLVECMKDFGPTPGFNTERCEAFNSYIRAQNIYGNKRAPSRDIAYRFAIIEHIRYICEGGFIFGGKSCGSGLKELYQSSMFQHFMNGMPAQEVFSEKSIYQPGALRKRIGLSISLLDAKLNLPDVLDITLRTLNTTLRPFSIHYGCLDPNSTVEIFNGVIGQNGDLIQSGDFVKMYPAFDEMTYGVLLLSCKNSEGTKACIVRGLQPEYSSQGIAEVDERGCPQFSLVDSVFVVDTISILTAVSIVHKCNSSCQFVSRSFSRAVERENIPTSRLEFVHDYANLKYILNIFCLNS